jgi:hypothetical protein
MTHAARPESTHADGETRAGQSHGSRLRARDLVLLLPLLAALVFVAHFAIAMPVTDEWLFLDADLKLEGVDVTTRAGLHEARQLFPAKLSEHWIAVPFLVYHAIAARAHYDSRVFMYVTVALLALVAFLFRRFVIPSTFWVLPVVLLLFSASHYMDFMLGWQYTFALSITFPIVGLVILDRIPVRGSESRQAAGVLACSVCCAAGVLSSAPGFFGFPCALLLVALKPFDKLRKVAWIGVIAIVAAVLYLKLMKGTSRGFMPDARVPFEFLTGLGGPIFGTPHVLSEFGVDASSLCGIVILVCSIAITVRAARIGALDRIALPLCIGVLGILCVATSALARRWLGNWHLQLALPAVCGMYAAGWRLWRIDRTKHSAVPFFAIWALMIGGVGGWWIGITRYAPKFGEYHKSVETFARHYLDEPDRVIPYPGSIHLTPQLILFLSAHEHPLFDDIPPPRSFRPLPVDARVFVGDDAFLGNTEVALPLTLSSVGHARMLTVSVPESAHARGIVARIGSSTVILRRIRARHNDIKCCFGDATPCFAGLILSAPLADGPKLLELSLFD